MPPMQGVQYVYDTDLYAPIFEYLLEQTGKEKGQSEETDRALYILADHARAIAFLVADGVRPGNQGREYVLRRIIRRAALQAHSRIGMAPEQLAELIEVVVGYMGDFYEELRSASEDMRRIVTGEAKRFVEIYDSGMELLEREISRHEGGHFSGQVAFTLHDTYGFPVEVTREVLADRGLALDEAAFERAMQEQRERAREAMQGHERVVAAFRDQEIRAALLATSGSRSRPASSPWRTCRMPKTSCMSCSRRTRSTRRVAVRLRMMVGSPPRTANSRCSNRSPPETIRCYGRGWTAESSRSGTR